jgi:transposase
MAMSIMASSTRPVTGGVDTHKDAHVAAVVDHLGGVLGTASFPNRSLTHGALLAWMRGHGSLACVGVEGTGSYGAGLARHLRGEGVQVVEVNRPDRRTRRSQGKSDDIDAIAAARAALAGRHAGVPKTGEGIVESIRMLRVVRRSAMRARTQCANQIHTLVDTAPAELHDRWATLPVGRLLEIAERLPTTGDMAQPTTTAPWALAALAGRWHWLDDQITELDHHLDQLVPAAAPSLVGLFGVGTDTAGALLVAAGDNPDRLRSEASFAALCGTSPLPASSGRTQRHRLNRGGNRDANNALWRIALVRMAHDPTTRAYVERRTKDGLSKREIIRCLKRYIARQVFPHLHRALNPPG